MTRTETRTTRVITNKSAPKTVKTQSQTTTRTFKGPTTTKTIYKTIKGPTTVHTTTKTFKGPSKMHTTTRTTEGRTQVQTTTRSKTMKSHGSNWKEGGLRTSSASGGDVFSRLTAQTKTSMGKSRRIEDRQAREEWKNNMDSQLEYEESMMNMGGFVLKEQRYKKLEDSRSPVTTKTKKRYMKAATTGKIDSTYGVTTRTIWKDGKKQIITTRTSNEGYGQNQSLGHSKSLQQDMTGQEVIYYREGASMGEGMSMDEGMTTHHKVIIREGEDLSGQDVIMRDSMTMKQEQMSEQEMAMMNDQYSQQQYYYKKGQSMRQDQNLRQKKVKTSTSQGFRSKLFLSIISDKLF